MPACAGMTVGVDNLRQKVGSDMRDNRSTLSVAPALVAGVCSLPALSMEGARHKSGCYGRHAQGATAWGGCPTFFKVPFLAVLLFSALLPASVAHAEEPMATQPEECIFFGCPSQNEVDYMPEENLFLMSTQSGIRAFDIRSGVQRWHHPQGANMEWGRRRTLGWTSKNELFLLDKATGRELWRRREDSYGSLVKVMFSPDETRVMALYDAGIQERRDPRTPPQITNVLYEPEGQGRRFFGEKGDSFPVAFLPDGKTALFCRVKVPATGSDDFPREFFLVDLDNGKMSEGRVIPDSAHGEWPSLSASGLIAIAFSRKDAPTGLKVFDVRTGSLVRDLGGVPEKFFNTAWSADEKCLYFTTLDQKKACVLDGQTGAFQQTLSRPGHTLLKVRIQRPDEGPDMVLSQDEDRNFWFWPPSPDAVPTKLFDGRRIAPGNMGMQLQDGGWLTAHSQGPGADLLSVWRVEGMEKIGAWRLPEHYGYTGDLFNRTMTHRISRNYGGDGKSESNSIEVYAKDSDSPLFSGKGDPLALSPDGRFLVVQIAGKRAALLDLLEKRTAHTFDARSNWDTQIYAAFSDDGCRVAVNAWPTLEVVDLAADFPRRGMTPENSERGINCAQDKWHFGGGKSLCFSPDGTLLLSGGYGRAWLHDVSTGKLLHTFVESRQFYEAQPYAQGGFMKSLEQSARDWAGLVTDRYKGAGPVYVSFSGLGDRVITHAAGQIIRVWDSRTGDLINVIETGLPEKRNQNWQISNRILLSENGDYALALNRDNFAPASLWSLADGVRIRRYEFPKSNSPDSNSPGIALSDDGKSVYVLDNGDLYRWPGRPKDAP